MKFTKLFTVIALLMSLLMGTGFVAAASSSITLPATIPGGLTDFKHVPKTIKDFTGKGKWLLVMFWASDCHICNREAYKYVDFQFTHSDTDATVLGVSIDGKAKFKEAVKFMKRHHINFPSLIGEPEDATAIYSQYSNSRWIGTPSFLLFNPKGELLAAQVGAVPPKIIEDFIAKTANKKVADKKDTK